jgi:hypothetical protein
VGDWDDAGKMWVRRDGPNGGPSCPEKNSWDNLLPWRRGGRFLCTLREWIRGFHDHHCTHSDLH